MPLTIHWQAIEDSNETVVHVTTAFATLRLYLSGGVIRKSAWLVSQAQAGDLNEPLSQQVKQYLENTDSLQLTLALQEQGSAFSNRVWRELLKIPFGETMTYAQLAAHIGSGARAVANACRHNPFPGIIPCHRVVSAKGIGGFMGQSQGPYVELKRDILCYEASTKGGYENKFD